MRRLPPIIAASLLMSLVTWIGPEMASSATTGTKTIVVDPSVAGADDSDPGTASRPVVTIGQALVLASEYNSRSVPVLVLVHPAIYRESLGLFAASATTAAPITLQGAGEGVIVSGADEWSDWTGAGNGLYTHPWSERWGLASLPDGWDGPIQGYLDRNPVIRRQEMVFLDGLSLTQVMSNDELRSSENSFFVDENQGQILIHVPAHTDVSKASIEVATRPYLLQVSSRQNITIDRMSFQHAATPMPGAAVSVADSSNIVVSRSHFIWNSWTGLSLYQDEAVTIREVEANHNGVSGLTGSRISDLSVTDSETSYNNWRGSRGWDTTDHGLAIDPNFIDFATGQKFFSLRDATFTNVRAVGNLTGGIWLDYDNADVTFEHVVLSGNLTHGLMIEASQGPVSVVESEMCGNETGILVNNASNVRVVGSVLAGNLIGQLFLAGANGPRPVVEYDTGAEISVKAENWVVRGNDMAVDAGGPATGTYLGTELWSAFIETLDSDQNHYSSPTSEAIFGMPGGIVALEEWRAETGTDAASTFSMTTDDCRPPDAAPVGTQATLSPKPAPGSATSDGTAPSMVATIGWSAAAGVAGLALLAYAMIRRRGRRSRAAR